MLLVNHSPLVPDRVSKVPVGIGSFQSGVHLRVLREGVVSSRGIRVSSSSMGKIRTSRGVTFRDRKQSRDKSRRARRVQCCAYCPRCLRRRRRCCLEILAAAAAFRKHALPKRANRVSGETRDGVDDEFCGSFHRLGFIRRRSAVFTLFQILW